jgi:hypothetical protein
MSPSEEQEQPSSGPDPVHVVRAVIGWVCIVVGLLTVWLPIPIGLPLIVIGVLLVGPRSPIIRKAEDWLEAGLRRMSTSNIVALRWVGQRGLGLERAARQRIEQRVQEEHE